MKKLKKLSLNKEVVTKLQNDEMQRLNGGLGKSHWLCMTYFKTGGCYGSKVSKLQLSIVVTSLIIRIFM